MIVAMRNRHATCSFGYLEYVSLMGRAPRSLRATSDLRAVFIALGLVLALLCSGCDSGRQENPARSELPSTRGRLLFESYCSACHQLDGRGREGGGPPLADSPWVAGPERRLIRIVLHGLRGPIDVGEVTYRREMLGFGQVLKDPEIAELLSEVRRRFGGPSPAISSETVAEVRAATPDRIDYWTVEELLEQP